MTRADEVEESTWVALLHRPTELAPAGPEFYCDPRFGEHLAFVALVMTTATHGFGGYG